MWLFKSFLNRVLICFTIGFILTFPFPFFIFFEIGTYISKYFLGINTLWAQIFGISNDNLVLDILSDSTGLYLHLITLLVSSILVSVVWCLKSKRIHPTIETYYRLFISFFLALVLFKYGWDKVFKHQFYFPEPNTLFTPLNQLSKDILFWSSMGTSYVYSVFSGLIELIPAILLLFRKTRLLGGLIAFAVLLNVVMLNFGFDISVKVFSLFLLLLSIIVISPDVKRLIQLFNNKNVDVKTVETLFTTKKSLLKYALLKSLVIGLILFESIGPYVKVENFNDDNFPRPYLFGAYTVIESNEMQIKNVFFHRNHYFIIQYVTDKFESFELNITGDKKNMSIWNELDPGSYDQLSIDKVGDTLWLEGKLKGKHILLKSLKHDLKSKPISKDSFYWTFDSFIGGNED